MSGIHPNSVLAFRGTDGAFFSKREQMVLGVLATAFAPLTDREVMVALGFADPNSVRPRITALVEAGAVVQCGDKRCPVTGKTVRLVKLAPRAPEQIEFQLAPAAVAALANVANGP